MRPVERRGSKPDSGFCRCGVTIAQRSSAVQSTSIILGQTFFAVKIVSYRGDALKDGRGNK